MSDKLGFTFYPKDWWTSESFFELDSEQRYIYLECIFIMYSNGGSMKTQKTQFENRTRISVTDENWKIVTEKFILENGLYTMLSVNKRLRKAAANRQNGLKGGRPPKNPNNPTLKPNDNPPSEREIESEKEKENNTIDNARFSIQVTGDRQWIETAFMKHRIDPEKISAVISSFNNHLILQGKQKQSTGEYKEHLSNWLRTTDLSEYQHQMSVNGKTNQRGKTAKDYGDE